MPKINLRDVEGNRWDVNSEDEHLWWPRVLWIDPGVVSGVACVWFDPRALLTDGQSVARSILGYTELFLNGPEAGLNGQVNRFMRLRNNLAGEPGLATGCESFVIRKMDQSDEFLSPVRIRSMLEDRFGMLKPLGAEHIGDGTPLWSQAPNDAKATYTDDRLRSLRMYTPGPDHVNDAKRHCLLWLRRVQAQGMDFFKTAHGYEQEWFE